MKLYLMRHGETEWSLSGQHTGSTDIPLTTHGEEEARQLAPRLIGIRFSAALCSPRRRAQVTCELAGLGALARVEPDLAEWDYGDYEGLRIPEIIKERAGWNIFADGCPNGELPNQVAARADRAQVCESAHICQHSLHPRAIIYAMAVSPPANQSDARCSPARFRG